MAKQLFRASATFLLSAPVFSALDHSTYPEIGVIGRSNVGKSALLNALFGRLNLVRSSKTPGRTQALNVFLWGNTVRMVDMPGYGYAKLSHQERARLWQLNSDYIRKRSELRGLLVVLDVRREEISPYDIEVVNMALQANRLVLIVLNKCDTIPRTQLLSVCVRLEKQLGVPRNMSLPVSAKTGMGLPELRQRIFDLCQESPCAGF